VKSITRRGLIASLGVTAIVVAQEEPSKTATIDDDLKTAREAMRANSSKLAAVKLPMAIEPAFVFKA
jgi:hypothetical protein